MKLQDMIDTIRGASYLAENQKQKWLQAIPQMSALQLAQLAEIIS